MLQLAGPDHWGLQWSLMGHWLKTGEWGLENEDSPTAKLGSLRAANGPWAGVAHPCFKARPTHYPALYYIQGQKHLLTIAAAHLAIPPFPPPEKETTDMLECSPPYLCVSEIHHQAQAQPPSTYCLLSEPQHPPVGQAKKMWFSTSVIVEQHSSPTSPQETWNFQGRPRTERPPFFQMVAFPY